VPTNVKITAKIAKQYHPLASPPMGHVGPIPRKQHTFQLTSELYNIYT